MDFYLKRRWRIIRDYCIGWTLAFVFLSVVRGIGTEEQGSLKFDFLSSVIISITMGPFMGFFSGLSQVWMEERIYRRISIGRFLFFRLLYAILVILFLVLLAYGVYQLYFGTDLDIISFAFDDGSFAIYAYVLAVELFLNVLRQINMLLGSGNLAKFLRGAFYHPREESRIFMFLDLQGSTSIAEKLGHVQYSSFIQECFNDLGVVVEFGAEIYQYVGDEAVLTWDFPTGLEKGNMLRAFYRFKDQLQHRKGFYEAAFGIIPVFKAGVHGGLVTVTEIGKYKREIAYHGDAINTAARIQAKCNEIGHDFLISGQLMNKLQTTHFDFLPGGKVKLKGKQQEIDIFLVSKVN